MEFNKQTSTVRSSASEAIIDQGLRSYMLKVYNYMASGVLLTGFIALAFFKMAVVTSDGGQIVGLPSRRGLQACAGGSVTGAVHPTNINGSIINLFIFKDMRCYE